MGRPAVPADLRDPVRAEARIVVSVGRLAPRPESGRARRCATPIESALRAFRELSGLRGQFFSQCPCDSVAHTLFFVSPSLRGLPLFARWRTFDGDPEEASVGRCARTRVGRPRLGAVGRRSRHPRQDPYGRPPALASRASLLDADRRYRSAPHGVARAQARGGVRARGARVLRPGESAAPALAVLPPMVAGGTHAGYVRATLLAARRLRGR